MPPPIKSASLDLHLQSRPFYLYQFSTNHTLPEQVLDHITRPTNDEDANRFISITRTDEEISIVVDEELELENWPGEETRVSKWRCIRVQGPMELNLVGIMNHLTSPLKDAKIAVFALSTWNTDYLLVPFEHATRAVEALREDGWTVHG